MDILEYFNLLNNLHFMERRWISNDGYSDDGLRRDIDMTHPSSSSDYTWVG